MAKDKQTSGANVAGAQHAATLPKTTPKSAGETLQLTALLGDFRLLLILFVAFRLLMFMVYEPIVANEVERGVTAGGDFFWYVQLGALSERGALPFRDWWSEFPPIPSNLIVAVYSLLGTGVTLPQFAVFFGAVMFIADAGNLILVRKIGAHLYGGNVGMSLAWVYTILLAPAVMIWWNFEPLVTFFLLLALYWLLRKRDLRSALATAVGGLTKFTPLLILGALWRFRGRGSALRFTAVALGGFALVYALLFVQNARMTAPSLVAQFNKTSYQTVWALIDGNYKTGNFGTAESRLDPESVNIVYGNPAVVPGWLRLGAAALIGVFVFWRTRRLDDRGLVAFMTITLLIFFLQAQGWSPQWIAQIIPLALLCFPNRMGVYVIILLSAVTFAEYPVLWMRTADTEQTVTGSLVTPYAMLVLARTALLVGVCVALYRKLRQEPIPELT